MKKFATKLLVGIFSLVALSPIFGAVQTAMGTAATAEEKQGKQLDVYVIAGQSNAVGCSNISSVDAASIKTEYTNGFENVYFYNRSEGRFEKDLYEKVKFGQGATDAEFGAEIGIADVLKSNATTTEALIVKCAYGATYLTDNTSKDASKRWGNWCPPSMPRSNETISASNAEVGTFGAKISGHLYDKCMATVEEAVQAYEAEGYTASLKGTFWMQGEAECDGSYASGDYKGHLTALINDMREDYVEIFQDDYAVYSPFVIGKIAPTFAGGGSTVEAVRSIQEQVASAMSSVYCVETEDYIIVGPDGNPAPGCDDRFHFNGNDMLSLGKEVGNKLIFGNQPHVQIITTPGGSADIQSAMLTGEPVAITFTANKNWRLTKVYKDDVDVTADVVDGKYTVTDTEGIHVVKAEFAENAKYKINFIYDKAMGSVASNRIGASYVGTQITVTVEANEGYLVKSVTFNGQAVSPDDKGKYVITIADGKNDFAVEYENQTGETPPEQKPEDGNKPSENTPSGEDKNGGCGGTMSALTAISLLLPLAIFAGKKKEN